MSKQTTFEAKTTDDLPHAQTLQRAGNYAQSSHTKPAEAMNTLNNTPQLESNRKKSFNNQTLDNLHHIERASTMPAKTPNFMLRNLPNDDYKLRDENPMNSVKRILDNTPALTNREINRVQNMGTDKRNKPKQNSNYNLDDHYDYNTPSRLIENDMQILEQQAITNSQQWTPQLEEVFQVFSDQCSKHGVTCKDKSQTHKSYDSALKVASIVLGVVVFSVSISNLRPDASKVVTGILGALITGIGSVQSALKYAKKSELERAAWLQLDKMGRSILFELNRPVAFRAQPIDYIASLETERLKILRDVEIE